jgi:hypothetical protein
LGGGLGRHLPVGPDDRALVVVRSKAAQAGVAVERAARVDAALQGMPLWDAVVPLLVAERLNVEPGRAGRWASKSSVLRLRPVPDPPAPLRHRHAAIDRQSDAGDVRRDVAGQEDGEARQLGR